MGNNITFLHNQCIHYKYTFLFLLISIFPFVSFSQQQVGYYTSMDGGFENQASGSLGSSLSTSAWSYVSSGNGQYKLISSTGGYGGSSYLTVGKTNAATINSSTTVNSNEVTNTTFAASTKYVVQFFYRANAANAATPDPASYIFISADGTSGNRITNNITLSTPSSWTLFTGNVTTNSTTQTTTGTAGINIKTTTIGTATLVDIDNFVIYPADNQTTGAPDVTPPGSVTGASSSLYAPAQVSLGWTAPSGGTDNGGYVVVRYTTNSGSTDNPLQNAIYAIGDTVANTNNGIVVYTGKTASCIDSLNVSVNITYYYRIYTVDKAFNYSSAALTSITTTHTPTNYYIDAISGNDANTGKNTWSAWKTIASINSNTFYAGDSVLLKCGDVWTGTTLHPLGSGQSGKPIVISSYGTGALPEIDADGSGLHNLSAAYFYNQEYFTISNLILTNNYAATKTDTTITMGLYVLATDAGTVSGITIKNLTIHDVWGTYDSTKYSGGIFLSITGSNIVTLFDSLAITGCTIYNVDYTGISNQSSWSGRSISGDNGSTPWRPSTNMVVSNNNIDSTGGNGMIIRVAQSPLIQNNILWKCAKRYTGNAMFVYNCNDALVQYNEAAFTVYNTGDADASGFDGDYECRRSVFQYNYSHDNDGGFAVVVCQNGGTPTYFDDSCVFRYNISQSDGHHNSGNLGYVINVVGQTTNTFFYNNTIYSSTDFNDFVNHHPWGGGVYPATTTYYNNIFYINKASAIYSMGSSTGNTFGYNDYYEPLGGTHPTDANALTANPNLVSAGSGSSGIGTVSGYKLAYNSPCINVGTTVVTNAPTADYWGNTVPNGNTDIGANEFGSNWTGAVGTAWNATGNWYDNIVPTSTSDVLIPFGKTNYPTISSTSSLRNLIIASGASLSNNDTIKVYGTISNSGTLMSTTGTFGFNGSTAQTIPANTFSSNTIQNLVINNSAGVTLGGTLNITGTLTPMLSTFSTGGYLTLISNSSGTARIDQVLGSISGNVTVQRYIPAKTSRKFSFIGSPVSESIRNAWQQQVFITGAGTGGTPCGNTALSDGATGSSYNSNGFDVTQTNTPSMFTYNATKVNGSRYVSVANTDYTNLSPGKGYCINIRGNRNSGDVNCAKQLESATPTSPEAVTLSATGTVTTGNVSTALNNPVTHPYTLLANPYPCQISFSAFKSSNSNIYNNMWTYSPFGNGNYTTYSSGIITNGTTGFDNTNGNYIASGQAFFVQANTTGNVTFQESHKTNGTIPNAQYFGTTNNKLIRVGLKSNADSSLLDEIVVRFDNNGTKGYNPSCDAASFNSGNQVLVSLKEGERLAIASYPDSVSADTLQLGIRSVSTGIFQLIFSGLEEIDSSKTITLRDKYLGVNQEIRNNQSYSFSITSDTNSYGNSRFDIILGGGNNLLPVNFTSISATQNNTGVAVKWSVANETGIAFYSIERSNDGNHFTEIATTKPIGTTAFSVEDKNIPTNANTFYYRIKSISEDGSYGYSLNAKLTTNRLPLTTISIFPNPLTGKTLNAQFSNTTAGKYVVRIYTILGEKVEEQTIVHEGGNANHLININQPLAKGFYSIRISKEGDNVLVYQTSLSMLN